VNIIVELVIIGLMALHLGIGLGVYLAAGQASSYLKQLSRIDRIGTEIFMIISLCVFWPLFISIIRKEQNLTQG